MLCARARDCGPEVETAPGTHLDAQRWLGVNRLGASNSALASLPRCPPWSPNSWATAASSEQDDQAVSANCMELCLSRYQIGTATRLLHMKLTGIGRGAPHDRDGA